MNTLLLPRVLAEAFEARDFFRGRGLRAPSLRAYRRAWLSPLHLLPPEIDLEGALVVDLGANEGDFSASVLALAPQATILAVEPAPGPRERLELRLGSTGRVTIEPRAVAAEVGTARLQLTVHDHNSSLRAPRAETGEVYEDPGWDVVEEVEVQTTSLDELVGDRPVSVLKLDVQGAEREVIAGGRRALSNTAAVLMEVTFISHYEGDATFQELNTEMLDLGFELAGLSSPGRTRSGRPAWADACYARPDSLSTSR